MCVNVGGRKFGFGPGSFSQTKILSEVFLGCSSYPFHRHLTPHNFYSHGPEAAIFTVCSARTMTSVSHQPVKNVNQT